MWKPAYQAVKRLVFTMDPVKLIFSMPIKQTETLLFETSSWLLNKSLAKTDMPKRAGPKELCHSLYQFL